MSNDLPTPDPASPWDRLLAKYVRVWLWSLLFGATSGVTYSYVDVPFDTKWGSLIILPLALFAVGVAASLGAWFSLFNYLRYAIVPEFFADERYDQKLEVDERDYRAWRTRRAITQTYRFLILAGLTRFGIVISYMAFEMLQNRSFGVTGSL
jgi:hypothetical protein